MDMHYNAFISYRHHPDDIRAARQIHQGLERFKIPRKLKRENKNITRLFRDKDELPITSSLSDDITRALASSDYLIVICSPHTKESVWVQREIEEFLRTHSRDKVLTVLREGEPEQVIPEILLYEDVVNEKTGEVIRRDIEPLFCDWRVKPRIAKHEELPRLAAALLGCSYDELRRRQRQYRTRRMAALFSAALAVSLCLAAYFIYNSIRIQKANDQIQANLEQALANQSRYLASSAQKLAEDGDRLTAIALALEALPDGERERPYVPAAEMALSDALNSYISDTAINAVGAFDAGAAVSDFCVTPDGKRLYLQDDRNLVTVWDTETFEKLASIETAAGYAGHIQKMLPTKQGNVILVYDYTAYCFDPEGTLLWQQENYRDVAFWDDRQTVLLMLYRYGQEENPCSIAFLDPVTGQPQREELALPLIEGIDAFRFFLTDNRKDVPLVLSYYDIERATVCTADVQTGEVKKIMGLDETQEDWFISNANLDEAGNVLTLVSDGTGIWNGTLAGGVETTGPAGFLLSSYNSKTGALNWQTKLTFYSYGSNHTVIPIPGKNRILCQMGNFFGVYDAATGREVTACHTTAAALTALVDEAGAWGVLANGKLYNFYEETGQCIATEAAKSGITNAVIQDGLFVCGPLDTAVTVYRSTKAEGIPLEGDWSDYFSKSRQHGSYLALTNADTVALLDMTEKRLLWSCSDEGISSDFPPSFSPDGKAVYVVDSRKETVTVYDVETGAQSVLPLRNEDVWNVKLTYIRGEFWYTGSNLEGTSLYRMNPETGEIREMPLPESWEDPTVITADAEQVWLRAGEQVCILNLAAEETRTVLTQVTETPVCAWKEDGSRLLLAAEHTLYLLTREGQVELEVNLEERRVASLLFFEEALLVLCDDGSVYRYSAEGALRNKIGIHIFNTFSQKVTSGSYDPGDIFWQATEDGDLILNVLGAGNLIHTGKWQNRAYIPNMKGYDPQSDMFITGNDSTFFAYPRYSTQAQIERGKAALGTFRLTQQQRQSYGLE